MSKDIVVKWMDGDKKREGRVITALDRAGKTVIVIYGTDSRIYELNAKDIQPI